MVRCLICNELVDPIGSPPRCPNCGAKAILCDPADDARVMVNWEELKLVFTWAEAWGKRLERSEMALGGRLAVVNIAKRLEAQYPGKPPLTVHGELDLIRRYVNRNEEAICK